MTSGDDGTRSHKWATPGPQVLAFWEGGSTAAPVRPGSDLVLGRAEESDLHLLHASVSRRHAILHAGPPMTLEDLGSANGCRVNGVPLRKGRTVVVGTGDQIELGAVVIVVQGEDAPLGGRARAAEGRPMERLRRLVELIARGQLSVLILGETGVGKESTVDALHQSSARAARPLLKINCAAFGETLLESELFGHEKGAFTGATAAKVGLIEATEGGTLFLDEVGELPLATQAKLLRVLENREVRRVGATRSVRVDVRFVAATNRDLPALVKAGAFRSDLYYRINGVTLVVPPLRDRRDEIPALIKHFLETAAKQAGLPVPQVTERAARQLSRHSWPGNVRELRNVIERALLLCEGSPIDTPHLQMEEGATAPAPGLVEELEQVERERIVSVLAEAHGNQTAAAKALGISRRTLIHRIETYRLPRPRKK